jgi:hypothetical protein
MEPVYDVGSSYDGKGQIIATKEGIGQNVFVCDSKNGNVIRADVHSIENRNNNRNNHQGIIELPQDWIGRQVHIRPFMIFSS